MCRNPEQVKMVDRRTGMVRAAVAAYLIILILVVMVCCLIVALAMQEAKTFQLMVNPPCSMVTKEKPCAYS